MLTGLVILLCPHFWDGPACVPSRLCTQASVRGVLSLPGVPHGWGRQARAHRTSGVESQGWCVGFACGQFGEMWR